MKDISELFWGASLEEMKKGYVFSEATEEFICLICGKVFVKGVVYQNEQVFYEAERFAKLHIEQEHNSMFEFLLNMDKKYTGLTEHQKSLLRYFYKGFSDSETAKELEIGSTSTIRNHRFNLREKEKQAKVFLAIMELLESRPVGRENFIAVPRTAQMVDERFAITREENDKILKACFKEGVAGPLSKFPSKEKARVVVIKELAKRFDAAARYTEKEVNEILKKVYHDYVLLRRYLIEYGFLDRKADGSMYWVKL